MSSTLVIFLTIIALALGCNPGDSLKELAEGNHKFSADVYEELAKSRNGSFVVSPLSAETILALTAEGARGQTEAELSTALNLPCSRNATEKSFKTLLLSLNVSSDNLKLLSANKIYVAQNYTIKNRFERVAVDVFQAGIEGVNFADNTGAANSINRWVEARTNDRIQNLISPGQLDAQTRLVLVNALYFSGKWVNPFQPSKTRRDRFYYSENNFTLIDFMHSNNQVGYFHCSRSEVKVLRLDYRDSNISVTFVLPVAREGIEKVERNIEKYVKFYNFDFVRVAVSLPKFSTQTSIDFKAILQDLGVHSLFDPRASDLSDISGEALYVNFVVQKAYINITETGTEAAAATGVGIIPTFIEVPPVLSFNADHPFIYYIVDNNSGVILFIGKFNGY